MMNNNPIMQLVQIVNSGGNPMGILGQAAQQSPQFAQAFGMIQGKNAQQLQAMAHNMAKERGIDINQLMSQLGLQMPG